MVQGLLAVLLAKRTDEMDARWMKFSKIASPGGISVSKFAKLCYNSPERGRLRQGSKQGAWDIGYPKSASCYGKSLGADG